MSSCSNDEATNWHAGEFVARIYDEEYRDPNFMDTYIVWTTYWELRWDAVPGAVDYLIYYATAEGVSTKLHLTDEPCWRLSVARGIGMVGDRDESDWNAQLRLMAMQLEVIVAARFANGSVVFVSQRFPVGVQLERVQ